MMTEEMKMEVACYLIFLLVCIPATECTKDAPYRSQCNKVGRFANPVKDFALLGHVVSTHSVSSGLDCAFECLTHPQCASYNCEVANKPQLVCELNDKKAATPSVLTSKPGYDYYDTEENLPDACASSPCVKSECVDSCVQGHGFECLCIADRYGDRCQYWTRDAPNYDMVFTNQTDYAEVDYTSKSTDCTICVWFKTQAEGWRTLFSQARDSMNTGLYLRCENMKQCEFMFAGEKRIFDLINPLNDGKWHHMCVVHTRNRGSWYVFIDGVWRAGQARDFAKSLFLETGKIVLGQKLLILGGEFDESEAFVGGLSQFNIWGYHISHSWIKSMPAPTKCRLYNLGNALDWRDFFLGQRRGVEIQKPSACQSTVPEIDFSFNFPSCDVNDYVTGPSLSNLSQVTSCFWLRKSVSVFTVFSYGTEELLSAFTFAIGSINGHNVYIMGEKFAYPSPPLLDDIWHHICITWENAGGVLSTYLDGVRMYRKANVEVGKTIPSGGKLHIGQFQNSYGGNHRQSYRSVGLLSGFNIWSTVLSEVFVVALSKALGTEFGDVISWKTLAPNVQGAVTVTTGTGADNTDECRRLFSSSALETDFYLKFPTRETTNYVSYIDAMPSLTAFTACLWMKTTITTDVLAFLSYAIPGSTEEIQLMYSAALNKIILAIGPGSYADLERRVEVGPLYDNAWHHLCLTWTSSEGTYTVWHQGIRKVKKSGYQTGITLGGNGTLIIGQKQDSYGGGFTVNQSFQGKISRLNIWDHVLQSSNIVVMSRGCGLWNGNVLPWKALRFSKNRIGNVGYYTQSPCSLAAATVLGMRDKYCTDTYGSSECSGSRRAHFDRNKNQVGKLWRCYMEGALKESDNHLGYEYDVSVGSTCVNSVANVLLDIN